MARGYPDFEGGKSGVYLTPEWAAKEGTDKNFAVYWANQTPGSGGYTAYVVPVGKILYITGMSVGAWATNAAESDLHQTIEGQIYDNTLGLKLCNLIGDGGQVVTFHKPLVVGAGTALRFYTTNRSNHNSYLYGNVWGYEI